MENQTTTSSGGSHHQPSESPRPCARECGFLGTPENRGLCSKCYSDYIKQVASKSIINEAKTLTKIEPHVEINNASITDEVDNINSSSSSVSDPTVVMKRRCGNCNKKVGLLGFVCRCGETFCGLHRYPEAHTCDFDFKTRGKIAIQKENPVCKADKILDRI